MQELRKASTGTSEEEDAELVELENELEEVRANSIDAENRRGKRTWNQRLIRSQFVQITLDLLREAGQATGPNVEETAWKTGDRCMAKFYEDDEYYPAVVKEREDDETVLVEFEGYGNQEVVAVGDLQRIAEPERAEDRNDGPDTYQGVAAPKRPRTVVEGGQIRTEIPKKMQIREGDDEATIAKKRKMIRSFKKAQRSQALDTITQEKQAAWKSFQQSKLSRGKSGSLTGKRKNPTPSMH